MDNNTLFYRIMTLVMIVIGMWWLKGYLMKKPEQPINFFGGGIARVLPVNINVHSEDYGQPVRWWESTDLCMVAVVMPFSGNLKKLHAFLDKQIKMVDFICSINTSNYHVPAGVNEKGINKPCLDAYMKMQLAVDIYLKAMIKDHGGPLIDKNWNE